MSFDLNKINPRLLKSEPIQRCNFSNCKAACCVFGAWVDDFHKKEILSNSILISQHMRKGYEKPSSWFNELSEPDQHSLSGTVTHTTVLDNPDHYGGTACIFMREDHKCTLQVASEVNGDHPWRFKPFYCILHPLDLDEQGRITLDETKELVNEPASCVRKAEHKTPLIEIFSEELEYLLGKRINKKNG